MFATQLQSAIEGAYLHQLDHLSCDLWKAHTAEILGDDDAQRLAELIHARREALRGRQIAESVPQRRFTIFKPRRLQRPAIRSKSIERRRKLAASSPLPPRLSGKFTTGAMAVLRVIADATGRNGAQCVKSVAEIAARAGVCHRLAQYTLRLAEAEGLIEVQERPQHGAPNLANIVSIICADWLAWLKGRRGCKKVRSTTISYPRKEKKSALRGVLEPILEGVQGGEDPPPRRC